MIMKIKIMKTREEFTHISEYRYWTDVDNCQWLLMTKEDGEIRNLNMTTRGCCITVKED